MVFMDNVKVEGVGNNFAAVGKMQPRQQMDMPAQKPQSIVMVLVINHSIQMLAPKITMEQLLMPNQHMHLRMMLVVLVEMN